MEDPRFPPSFQKGGKSEGLSNVMIEVVATLNFGACVEILFFIKVNNILVLIKMVI